jgi:hypothetical protein
MCNIGVGEKQNWLRMKDNIGESEVQEWFVFSKNGRFIENEVQDWWIERFLG